MKVAIALSFAIAGLVACPAQAQAPAATKAEKAARPKSRKAAEPLFRSNDVIDLTIKAPFASLSRSAAVADAGVAGTVTVGGTADALPVTLSPRGITRRKRETCPFPPLWVEFAAKPPSASVFKGQIKLKLVTHCRAPESFQQFVLLEYAAYRLANVVMPASFQARLARINYVDQDGTALTTRTGFLIEDGGEVAKRNALHEVRNVPRIRPPQLDPRAAARFAVFENMIGNLDWAMIAGPPGSDCCHNSRLMGARDATGALVPVPYDFDYAGIVDAPYAVPPAQIKIASVRTRRYRGYCLHNAELGAVAAEFNAKRPQLLAVIDDLPQLDAGARAKARSYLEGFFEQIASPAAIADKFEKNCL